MNVGIIGNGFVGNAVYQNVRDKVETKIYDVDKNRSLNTFDEVLQQELIFVCVPTPMKGQQRSWQRNIHCYG
jgi:prephenate dehydrogenase